MVERKRNRARDYTRSTIRRLDILSGNQCAAPDCDRKLLARDGESIVSKICHIEAASPEGPRWNPDMSDYDRRHFSNLILLCDECHTIIDNKDNENDYPVDLLKCWKFDHESKRTYEVLIEHPSLLGTVVDALADLDLDSSSDEQHKIQSFDIQEKIEYNAVKRNRALIEENKVFYPKLSALYESLEEEGSFKKQNLLRNIRRLYLQIKGRYVEDCPEPMEVVRVHSDDIIEDVQDELLVLVETGNRNSPEDVAFGVSVVMVDAFMRCKILEVPPS